MHQQISISCDVVL